MTGRHAELVPKVKRVASNIQGTYFIIHREMLATKTISAVLNQVLIQVRKQ